MQTRPPPPRLHRRQLEILAKWPCRCPVKSIKLKHWWYVDDDDSSSAVDLLNAIFANSTLKSVAMSITTAGQFIAITTIRVPLQVHSLDLSHSSLVDTALVSLATGLCRSCATSLDLNSNEVDDTVCDVQTWRTTFVRRMHSAKEFSDAFARAPRLASLQLCENELTLQGAIPLVTALIARPQVTTLLDLSGNYEGDSTAWSTRRPKSSTQGFKGESLLEVCKLCLRSVGCSLDQFDKMPHLVSLNLRSIFGVMSIGSLPSTKRCQCGLVCSRSKYRLKFGDDPTGRATLNPFDCLHDFNSTS
ncbi:hypothetical protein Ae201684P_002904 [Aphanomyces euteiches]|nr:hypothetical protein Ae201684P_002904 [Aphanomyces euteiches]